MPLTCTLSLQLLRRFHQSHRDVYHTFVISRAWERYISCFSIPYLYSSCLYGLHSFRSPYQEGNFISDIFIPAYDSNDASRVGRRLGVNGEKNIAGLDSGSFAWAIFEDSCYGCATH